MHTTRLHSRRRPLLATALALGLALVLTACGAGRVARSSAAPAAPDASPTAGGRGDVALLATESGVTAVHAGTTDVRWSAAGAVAALDGSAVFARDSGALVRLDPVTGEEVGSWPVDAVLHPVVVAPGGRWVALTDRPEYVIGDPPAARTTVLVVDGRTGRERARFDLDGDLEPEAFSPGGETLVVLDHRGETYRVDTLDLGTGERYPTIDENKEVVGDMAGRRVRGVLSADRQLLATLYQAPGAPQPGAPEPGAFVHVLHLGGWTYCVGLPGEFGDGPPGSVAIERHGDEVVVVSEHADRRATFSLADLVVRGSNGVRVTVTTGAGERADAPYRTVSGFRALVAVVPETRSG